ncbi:hypothetical protein KJ564_16865 [bacterium]|nr:hypothetical protein [bacterium]
MERVAKDHIIYSINEEDLQNVAHQLFDRELTRIEINLIEGSIGDYIDWFQAIENTIVKHKII